MNRRKFIKGITALAGLGLLSGLYAWQIEPFWVDFSHVNMPIKNLPNSLTGKTLMQISDLHVGKRIDMQFIINSFEKAKQKNPDFVVYTGDFINKGTQYDINQLKKVFQNPVLGKLGTIAVLGNHDYGKNWKQNHIAKKVIRILNSAGIKVLRNDNHIEKGINFIGIDDYWATNFYPKKAMKKYHPKMANIVLCHNPDVCDLNIWNHYQGWILSGHTHGGQVKAPFLPPFVLPVKNKKFTSGVIDLNDGRMLYINRALGSLLQVRFNVRPEITIFELYKV